MKQKTHIIIIGWDEFAEMVARQIIIAGKIVRVISDKEPTNSIDGVNFICTEFNDFKEIERADVNGAIAVLINLADDTEKLKYVIQFRKYFKNKKAVVPINDASLKETFCNIGVQYPLSKNEIAAKIISSFLFEKDVALFCQDLIASAEDELDYDLQQYKILKGTPFCDMEYGDAFKQLRNDYNVILMGLSQCDKDPSKRILLKNPSNETLIKEGDYLIMLVNGHSAKDIKNVCMIDEGVVLL